MPNRQRDKAAGESPPEHNDGGFVKADPAAFATSYRPSAIDGDFCGKHIITVDQFARADLEMLFATAATLKKRLRSGDRGVVEIASGQVLALLFFESSTRTDMSFQAAMLPAGRQSHQRFQRHPVFFCL